MKNINIRPLIVIACVVIAVLGMHTLAPVINPFLLALLIVVSLSPLLDLMLNKGWPKMLALTLTILFVVLFGVLMTIVVGTGISEMSDKVPFYQERMNQIYLEGLQWLAGKGIDIEEIQNLNVFTPDRLLQIARSFLGGIFSSFGSSIMVLLLIIFTLIEFANVRIKLKNDEISKDSWIYHFIDIAKDLRKYISITAMAGFFTALGQLILMLVIGIDFAIVWAFLSFLLNFIPNIGFILTIIPPALIALLKFGWVHCVLVLVGFSIINEFFNTVLKPKYVGQEFKMSLLTIFLSMIFWTWVLGAVGAILSVPLTRTAQRMAEALKQNNDDYKAFLPPDN